uniref:Transmembrane protein n=1 Tax=Cucumis melo TaxID=3656 RepID=A0A9I9CYM1_CUCME
MILQPKSITLSSIMKFFTFPFLFSLFLFLHLHSSSASNHSSHLHSLRFHAVGRGDFVSVVELWKAAGRNLVESIVDNSSLILAETRTYRKDPLNNFQRYTGGWNIKNKHYWASVAFTAAPFFVIAGIWFIVFGLSLFLICLCYCCCRREPYGYSRLAYALSLIFLILFTIAAIVGCIVLYTGQGKFHSITTRTLDYVVGQADDTVVNLHNVSDYLSAAKKIGVATAFLSPDIQTKIDDIDRKLNSSATTLSEKTGENSENIQYVLDHIRLALIILAAVMLLLAFLGFLFSILGMQSLVYSLVIIGWILVAGTFILCGVFLLLHNVVADTCVSMNEWVQNPTAHTALDDILPCVDNATAQETLTQSKNVAFQLVDVVNNVITGIANGNFPPSAGAPFYFNQSGSSMPILCNPFYSNLTDRLCASGEVELGNATVVWRNFVCEASASGICTTPGRLTPTYYGQMTAAVNVTFGLYKYGPYLVSLQDCSFVRQTFTDIQNNYCPGLRRYTQWIYIGLVLVSAAVMLSLIFWVIYARERRHRVYTKSHMGQ